MESIVLDSAIAQGLWAVLFVATFSYLLRENSKREAKYQSIIDNLTIQFCIVQDVQDDVKDIIKKLDDEHIKKHHS